MEICKEITRTVIKWLRKVNIINFNSIEKKEKEKKKKEKDKNQ